MQVLLYQFRFALVLALGILVWETVVKFSQSNRVSRSVEQP